MILNSFLILINICMIIGAIYFAVKGWRNFHQSKPDDLVELFDDETHSSPQSPLVSLLDLDLYIESQLEFSKAKLTFVEEMHNYNAAFLALDKSLVEPIEALERLRNRITANQSRGVTLVRAYKRAPMYKRDNKKIHHLQPTTALQ